MVMGFRAWLFVAALLLDVVAQPAGVLRIKVTILDADRGAIPVPRHALLVSGNPGTAPPQRTVTGLDGSAQLHLRPGNYTVESDQPLVFHGKAYQWSQTLDVAAGGVTSLELTTGNALVEAVAAGEPSAAAGLSAAEGNPSALLIDWQNAVVSIWGETKRGAGFLIDARGLVLTNQRLVGKETSLEVQLSRTEKVRGRVMASDADRNVAILWIDPAAVASVRPVKLGYTDGGSSVAERDKVFAITASTREGKNLTSGYVSRIDVHTIASGIGVDEDSLGVPLFSAAGDVIAITTPDDAQVEASSGALRAVRIDDARSVIADAEKKMQKSEAPNAQRLPVEPQRPFADGALKEAAQRRSGSLAPYSMPAADFEISLITPVLVYGAQHQTDRVSGREPDSPAAMQRPLRAVEDFGNWADYVRDDPPVLMIRATPKLVESFWTTVARGAARTQGVALPPIKHIKAGFSRMRIFCGDAEVTPIHPFKIEQRVDDTNAVYEGLYIVDPGAIGPHCGTVKLSLFSDKEPAKADTRVVDPKIVEQIWQDFAPYRAAAG
jgi:S1-C subfamily serine protease